MRVLYRYTTEEGEGAFSAARRHLAAAQDDRHERAYVIVRENEYWLSFPEVAESNLEFYWTEEGRRRYEHTLFELQRECVANIRVHMIEFEALPGTIVYEDEYQVGIRAHHDKSHLPNPYHNRAAFCF